MKFHSLEVLEVKQETSQAVAVTLKVPSDLKEEYKYKPGQYLTVKFIIDGVDQRRAYSMCSSPLEENITIGVKRVENGIVSNHVNNHISVGDHIDVMVPQGNFTVDCQETNFKKYILFGGGSGITPLLSIAKTVLATEPQSKLILLYANERLDTIMFRSQLEELQSQHGGRFLIEHVLNDPPAGWQGQTGWVDLSTVQSVVGNFNLALDLIECYICGPSGMMKVVQDSLETCGVPAKMIHVEYFVATDSIKSSSTVGVGQEAKVKVDFFGEEKNLIVPQGVSILQALKNKGIDAPFSCQSGVCSTCIARLTKGEVAMEFAEALDDDEIENGLILTCQAKCETDEVEVVFED